MKKIFILFTLFLLMSCNQIKEGEVIKKWHENARTWIQIVPMCISNGKTTTTMMIPMTHYDDEDFCITISKYDYEKEKFLKRTVYLSKSVYDLIEVGSWFIIDSGCETNDQVVRSKK